MRGHEPRTAPGEVSLRVPGLLVGLRPRPEGVSLGDPGGPLLALEVLESLRLEGGPCLAGRGEHRTRRREDGRLLGQGGQRRGAHDLAGATRLRGPQPRHALEERAVVRGGLEARLPVAGRAREAQERRVTDTNTQAVGKMDKFRDRVR